MFSGLSCYLEISLISGNTSSKLLNRGSLLLNVGRLLLNGSLQTGNFILASLDVLDIWDLDRLLDLLDGWDVHVIVLLRLELSIAVTLKLI